MINFMLIMINCKIIISAVKVIDINKKDREKIINDINKLSFIWNKKITFWYKRRIIFKENIY